MIWSDPPDWLNSIMFLLIGILCVIHKTPVKRERVGNVEVPVQRKDAIDGFAKAYENYSRAIFWIYGIWIAIYFTWSGIMWAAGKNTLKVAAAWTPEKEARLQYLRAKRAVSDRDRALREEAGLILAKRRAEKQ